MKSIVFTLITGIFLAATSPLSLASHNTSEALETRVQPVGSLSIMTKEEADAAAAEQAAAAALASGSDSDEDDGEAVYNANCLACHGAGIAGAPKYGDKAGWESRLAQGFETLLEHAIVGYQGEKGVMPARGGNASLSDDVVEAAVDYMVEAVE